jgi:hypothetical protein
MIGAFYDDDAFYDEEFYYDVPEPKKGNLMTRIAMKTSKLSPLALGARVQTSLSAIAADAAALTDADALVASILVQLETAREARDQVAADLNAFYGDALAGYVMTIANGNPDIILAAGLDVARGRSPSPTMTQVLNVKLVAGLDDGSAVLKWDPMFRCRSYEVQLSTNASDPTLWKLLDITTKHLLALHNQPGGQKLWARVRAINNVNKGPWSDAACCMIA